MRGYPDVAEETRGIAAGVESGYEILFRSIAPILSRLDEPLGISPFCGPRPRKSNARTATELARGMRLSLFLASFEVPEDW